MPRTIRFHLDENSHRGVAEGLRRYGIDVTTTPEANLRSAADDEQLRFAVSQRRALYTQDQDFLRLVAQGTEHCGILYCRQQTRSVGDIIRGLLPPTLCCPLLV
jgi:predicted nuclease of predicted toxin-antitoxin system